MVVLCVKNAEMFGRMGYSVKHTRTHSFAYRADRNTSIFKRLGVCILSVCIKNRLFLLFSEPVLSGSEKSFFC